MPLTNMTFQVLKKFFFRIINRTLINIASLTQCVFREGNIQNKKGYVAVMYHSPSQNNKEFYDFIFEFENMVNGLLQLLSFYHNFR